MAGEARGADPSEWKFRLSVDGHAGCADLPGRATPRLDLGGSALSSWICRCLSPQRGRSPGLYLLTKGTLSGLEASNQVHALRAGRGYGDIVQQCRAVLEALAGYQTEFRRTPKYQVVDRRDTWRGKRYAVHKNVLSVVELGVGLYFLWVIGFAITHGIYFPVPFIALFSLGFFYVGWMSLFQGCFQRLRAAFSRTEAPAVD